MHISLYAVQRYVYGIHTSLYAVQKFYTVVHSSERGSEVLHGVYLAVKMYSFDAVPSEAAWLEKSLTIFTAWGSIGVSLMEQIRHACQEIH